MSLLSSFICICIAFVTYDIDFCNDVNTKSTYTHAQNVHTCLPVPTFDNIQFVLTFGICNVKGIMILTWSNIRDTQIDSSQKIFHSYKFVTYKRDKYHCLPFEFDLHAFVS